MIRKTWHKQRYRRKIFKSYSIVGKTWYYMKPFIIHLIIVWLQPLPVPTILKLLYTMCLLLFIMFPFLYFGALFLAAFWVLQYIVERYFAVEFPLQMDLHRFVKKVINVDPDGVYKEAVYYHVENLKVMVATVVSFIDYVRLATGVAYGV